MRLSGLAAAILLAAAAAPAGRRGFRRRGAPVPILVTLSRYQFSPGGPDDPPIHLQTGLDLRDHLSSSDVVHGVSAIPALGIEGRDVAPGEDYVVTVAPTAAQRGRYNFACTRVCGAGHGGMHGAIEVEGPDDSTILRLGDGGRFTLSVAWSAVSAGTSGAGQAIPLTADSGAFWFFQPSNIELVIKVLDARVDQRPLLGLLRRPLERRVHDHRDRRGDRHRPAVPQPAGPDGEFRGHRSVLSAAGAAQALSLGRRDSGTIP